MGENITREELDNNLVSSMQELVEMFRELLGVEVDPGSVYLGSIVAANFEPSDVIRMFTDGKESFAEDVRMLRERVK